MCGLILLRLAAYGPIPLAYCHTLFSWKYNINHLSDYTPILLIARFLPIHDIHPYFMINRFTHNDYAINPSSLNIFGESVINFTPFVFVDEIIQNSTYVCASFVLIITVDEI